MSEKTTVRRELGVTMYCHYSKRHGYTIVQGAGFDAPSCFDDSAFYPGSAEHRSEFRNHLRRHARWVRREENK